MYIMRRITICLLFLLLHGCVATQPSNIANICDIFDDRRSWYKAAKKAEQRWGVPVSVAMAFIYQESAFRARAKPERSRILWIFPGPRPSSAYGYAQAVEPTWQEYQKSSGNRRAERNDFSDAVDFVAWYNDMSNRVSGIDKSDATNLYFAYHEGNGGYSRGTHKSKPWLIDTARRVEANAERFQAQYDNCRSDLDKNWFLRIFA